MLDSPKKYTKIRPVYNSRLARFLSTKGLVIYPYIFFAKPKHNIMATMFKHEMIHVRQVRETGWLRFYLSYIGYYIAGYLRYFNDIRAYLDIPYEMEAYALESSPLTEDEALELGINYNLYNMQTNNQPYYF